MKNKNLTLPNFFTYCNAAMGLIGISLIVKGNIILSIPFLTSCDIFDTLDGWAARKLNMFSPIGKDLDSLVDAIVFLIPPYLILFKLNNIWLTMAGILLVFAGIYRLARYNIDEKIKGKVKGLIASQPAHYLYFSVLLGLGVLPLTLICVISSVLMISTFITDEKITNSASKFMIVMNLLTSLYVLLAPGF